MAKQSAMGTAMHSLSPVEAKVAPKVWLLGHLAV